MAVRNFTTVKLNTAEANAVKVLRASRKAKATAEALERDAKATLAGVFDAPDLIGMFRGQEVARTNWVNRSGFDLKAFTLAHPDLAAQFTTDGGYQTIK
jgi:hypothetical protein